MLNKYFSFKPFSASEAWTIFKLAAFGEAIGWTVLITGVILGHYLHSSLPVLIAGQFHGILFLIYLATAVLASPSLFWRPGKILLAVACGVPPYGSLVFELWQAHRLNRHKLRFTLQTVYLTRLSSPG